MSEPIRTHVALYRKYRSQTFGDLIGQDHVVRTLQNAISQGRIGHAYLFTGPRGTGKTSTARLLAKALCCEKGPAAEPCNVCSICRSITSGSCMDVVELDAASESGVDQIRDSIVAASEYRPSEARFKVFIIDEVHDLSAKAFDALLKTIEEPPEHVVFILATTAYAKVPPTIRSRCQRFEFHRGTIQDLAKRLEHVAQGEGVAFEPSALMAIARAADGGYRDALTLFEQAVLTAEGPLTLEHAVGQLGLMRDSDVDSLLQAALEADVVGIANGLDAAHRTGRDPRAIVESMLLRLSDLTRAAFGVESGAEPAAEAALREAASRFSPDKLLALRAWAAEVHKDIRDVAIPRVWLESQLIRASLLVRQPAAEARLAPETRATRRAEPTPAAPRPVERPEPVRAAPEEASAPAHAAVQPVATTPASNAPPEVTAYWASIVQELSAKSPAARARLDTCRIGSVSDGKATVVLARNVDVQWVLSKAALLQAIREQWALGPRPELVLEYVAEAKSAEPEPEAVATVELPLEGEPLTRAAREVFGS